MSVVAKPTKEAVPASRQDVNATRAALESGDHKGLARRIMARFPKTMARLAK